MDLIYGKFLPYLVFPYILTISLFLFIVPIVFPSLIICIFISSPGFDRLGTKANDEALPRVARVAMRDNVPVLLVPTIAAEISSCKISLGTISLNSGHKHPDN